MINPSKLKTLVDTHAAGPGMAAVNNPMADESDDDDGLDDEVDGDDEETAGADPSTKGNELLTSWGEFGIALKEAADMIIENAHEVGADLLLEAIPEEAIEEAGDSVERMPEELQQGFAKYIASLSTEDCTALATALVEAAGNPDTDGVPDVALVCAYLTQGGAWAAEEVDVEEDEETEDDAEDAPEDDAEDAPADPAAEVPAA